jgi:hypothetical protein
MSTYFETYYSNGKSEVQLSDQYFGFCVSRGGTLKANFSQGEIYGVELSNKEAFVIARTNNDTLIISPCYRMSNGNKVVYIGTYNGTEVQYKVISLFKDISHNEHDAGIEIYNQDGKLIFSNTMATPQFEQHYLPAITYIYGDAHDYSFVRNDEQGTKWEEITIDDSSNKYIYSMQAPFGLERPFSDGWSKGSQHNCNGIYAGGYKFENNKIVTLKSTVRPSNFLIRKILGTGDINHFGVIYYTDDYSELDYSCGLWCGMYNFATMLV